MNNIHLDSVIFGNSLKDYFIAAGIFILLVLVFYIAGKLINRLLDKIETKTTHPVLSVFLQADKRLMPILQYLPFYIVTRYLKLPDKLYSVIAAAGVIIVTYCVVRYVLDLVKIAISLHIRRTGGDTGLAHTVNIIAGIVVWAMAVLFVLSNLGFNITTLITGLGIGGVAIALASQTLLADLFNYFTILIDRPFAIGDSVETGSVSGTVQKIGLKGTRLVSTTGEQIVVSNTDMTKSVLRNYHIMEKRRVLIKLGLKYDTPAEKMKIIPGMVETIVRSVPDTEFIRAHFSEFGDSALIFEVVYFVLSKDYYTYMDRRQQVNFKIMDEFAQVGADFAFPSQTIYMEK